MYPNFSDEMNITRSQTLRPLFSLFPFQYSSKRKQSSHIYPSVLRNFSENSWKRSQSTPKRSTNSDSPFIFLVIPVSGTRAYPSTHPKYQRKSVTVITGGSQRVHESLGRERYRKSSRPGGWILAGSDKEGSGRSGNQLNRKLRIKANTAKVPAGVSSPGSSWNSIYYPPPAGIHRPVDPRGRRHHTGERGGGALTQRYSRGTPPSIVVFQQCCSQSVCV